jgi:hypothetical protein
MSTQAVNILLQVDPAISWIAMHGRQDDRTGMVDLDNMTMKSFSTKEDAQAWLVPHIVDALGHESDGIAIEFTPLYEALLELFAAFRDCGEYLNFVCGVSKLVHGKH